VVHYSALLSAVAEKNPALALSVNMTGFQNMLELAKIHRLRIYSPSTIGAFGPSTPKNNTPDLTIMRPNTIYGITKLHNELLGEVIHLFFTILLSV
jgi:threonine 3-dehydrogenase